MTCINNCYDEGLQQVESLCNYCQSYYDSIEQEAKLEYKISPEYWEWYNKNHGVIGEYNE